MAEFSPDVETRKVSDLLDELFAHVLYDEEPLFISDEATVWDVSMSDPDDVLTRLTNHYGFPVLMEDTRQPLWKLLRSLDAHRNAYPRG